MEQEDKGVYIHGMEATKTCPICFEELKEGKIASPDICDHTFCLNCLRKWARRERVCPVDRKRFKKVIDLRTSLPILIKPRKRKKQPELYDVTVHCEVCSKPNNEETLILCDCCDLGFHCKCLTPPLNAVPSGVWNCPMCVAVSEKIRSKKGITKDVELLFKDHINSKSCSSGSDSSSNEPIKISRKESESSEKATTSWRLRKRPNTKRNTFSYLEEDSRSSNESDILYSNDASTSSNGSANVSHKRPPKRSLSNERLKRLRPRQRQFYRLGNSSSSSEGDSGIKQGEHYSLRNRNCNYSGNTHYALGESSSSGTFGVKESYSLRNRNQTQSKSKDFSSNSQDFRQEDFNFSFKAKHSIKKTFPEATITSGQMNTSNGMADLVIQHTISLKSANEFGNIEGTKSDSTINVSYVDNSKDLLNTCVTSDNTCNIRDESGKQVCDFNIKDDRHDQSNLNSNEQDKHEILAFSVFERQEDIDAPIKKYFNNCQATKEKSSGSLANVTKTKSTICEIIPKITSVKSFRDETSYNSQGTKILSKELLKMQKEKWKTYHLQSQKKCNCNLGLQWCPKHSKKHDSAHIGQNNKYSEHYNKLLSTTRLISKKPKFNQLDLVILKNVRKKTGIIYSSDNCSSSPNYNPYIHAGKEINSNQCKDTISMKAKNILKLKDTDKGLLKSVMCLPIGYDLAVRPDGTVFVNWKKS